MGDVTFKMDAKVGPAVRGFGKLFKTQKDGEKQFQKTTRAVGKQTTGLNKLGGALGKIAGPAALAGAATAAVGGLTFFAKAAQRDLDDTKNKIILFEDELTSLLSLGENLRKRGDIKKSVLEISNAWGRSRADIIDAKFQIQSGASDLSDTIQKDLLETSLFAATVLGGELPDDLRALRKSFQFYRDELKTVTNAQNKLTLIAELGDLQFKDMALGMPKLLSAAKALGVGFDELGGGIVAATQLAGEPLEAFLSFRNVILKMNEAVKAGLTKGNTIEELVSGLAKADPQAVADIFGTRGLSAISAMIIKFDTMNAATEKLRNVQGNLVKEKFFERMGDEAFRFAFRTKQLAQQEDNLIPTQKYLDRWGEFEIRAKKARIAAIKAAQELDPSLGFLGKALAGLLRIGAIPGNVAAGIRSKTPGPLREALNVLPGFAAAEAVGNISQSGQRVLAGESLFPEGTVGDKFLKLARRQQSSGFGPTAFGPTNIGQFAFKRPQAPAQIGIAAPTSFAVQQGLIAAKDLYLSPDKKKAATTETGDVEVNVTVTKRRAEGEARNTGVE